MSKDNLEPSAVRLLIRMQMRDRLKQVLDDNPALVHSWHEDSWTAVAASTGNLPILQDLLDRGLTVNDVGANGLSPLSRSVEYPSLVTYLLQRGADAAHPSVMIGAAAFGTPDVFETLWQRGGNITVRSGNPPRNAIEQAQMMGRSAIIDLIQRGVGESPFNLAEWLQSVLGRMEPFPPGLIAHDLPCSLRLVRHANATVCVTVGLSRIAIASTEAPTEALVVLPPNYPHTEELGVDPLWPVEWLLSCVHQWVDGCPILSPYHTAANGDPPETLSSDVPFVGSICVPYPHDEASSRAQDGNRVRLVAIVPLSAEELALSTSDISRLKGEIFDLNLASTPVRNGRVPFVSHG